MWGGSGAAVGNTGYNNGETLSLDKSSGDTSLMIRRQGIGSASFILKGNGTRNNNLDITVGDSNLNAMTIQPGGYVGVGTTSPNYILDVQHASSKVNSKNGYLTNGADYAEYFACEQNLLPGDIAGVDLATGKVRKYRSGDELVGIVADDASAAYVGNNVNGREGDSSYALVGLLGQLAFDLSQVTINGGVLYTGDGVRIGVLLDNGKAFIRL